MGKPKPVVLRAGREQGASAMPKAIDFDFARDDLDEAASSRSSGKQYSYEEMVELVGDDIHSAIAITQAQLQKANSGVRDQLYIGTMAGLAYAPVIADSDEEWERCCADPFWEKQTPDRSNPVLVAFKYVRRTLRGPMYEQTRFHAKAMQSAYRRGIKPADVKNFIKKAGGFKNLHKMEIDREHGEMFGEPSLENVDSEVDVSTADLPGDALQMDGVSDVPAADTASNDDSESDSSAPPATGPARTKRYAGTLKGMFRFEVVLSEKDGLAATNKSLAGDFLIRCRHVPNGDLTWVRVDGKLEL